MAFASVFEPQHSQQTARLRKLSATLFLIEAPLFKKQKQNPPPYLHRQDEDPLHTFQVFWPLLSSLVLPLLELDPCLIYRTKSFISWFDPKKDYFQNYIHAYNREECRTIPTSYIT